VALFLWWKLKNLQNLVTKFLIYIFENIKSYVQNEAHFRRVRWELNYFTKKCNILTRFLVDIYVTNIRLLWKCPFRLQRYSFITTLFLGPFDDVIPKFYCNCKMYVQVILGKFFPELTEEERLRLVSARVSHRPHCLCRLCPMSSGTELLAVVFVQHVHPISFIVILYVNTSIRKGH
jgi:hypothetical protein